jgi:hypothetical protein
MKGPKIDDWVRLMLEQTALHIHRNPNNIPPIAPVNHRDDIALWHWFVRAFKTAFTDRTRSEDTVMEHFVRFLPTFYYILHIT